MTLPILKAMRPDPAAPPVVLDLEAYGFGRHSYPIEVGYALPDGRVFCTFIRPEPDWTHWVDAAACLHQLPCPALLSRDRPAREVATLLNEQLCGFTVYTEGWNHDYTWLSLLFDAVDQEPRLRLGNLRAMLGEQRAERWQEVKQQVARESGCQRHRASSDARLLQLTLQWVRQDLQPPPERRPSRLYSVRPCQRPARLASVDQYFFVVQNKVPRMAALTIVFADLTGSTGLFEALGNARAAEVITRTTHWIGRLVQTRGARVIKYLGDGVLSSFADNQAAVLAMVEMQRLQRERASNDPRASKMQIKVGLARGEVVEQDGDCFGDAVNMASRLSDLSGAEQIFASESVIGALWDASEVSYRNLGAMDIRGKSEPITVYRIDWQRETTSEIMTMQAGLDTLGAPSSRLPSTIRLTWREHNVLFDAMDMPVFLGRGNDAQLAVLDPRVSRLHTRLDRRSDLFILTDISSYGTWVRFAGSSAVVALRRQECVLLDKGEMALGASFDDPTAPIINFWFTNKNA
ncbi:MAG: adenylate/guanylate cyclase domain-containing protein [Curvibacter sp.]|jgi:adenylate cyclase